MSENNLKWVCSPGEDEEIWGASEFFDTKEGTLLLFSEYAAKVAEVVYPGEWDRVAMVAARRKSEHEMKFGKMPEFVPFSIDKRLEEAE